ncbi:MAG: hypothetical protein M3Q69_03990 [Acidobacteriota bacterium]|nr:hypothetical protein [Acidobacteriota bacterium]
MAEAGGTTSMTVPDGGVWTTVLDSCGDELSAETTSMPYNVIWRYWLLFKSTTVPIGTPYQIEVSTTKNGITTVHETINRKVRHLSTESEPHVDYLAAYLGGLSGSNAFRVRMRILSYVGATASIDAGVGNFASLQGSHQQYGGAKSATATTAMTLDATWREISSVTLNNTSGVSVDVQLQSHLRVTSGTPGQRISVGIGREYASSGAHYSQLYVPANLPDDLTVLDYMPNEGVGDALIPPGISTFRVWAKVDTGTVTIADRRTEVLAMNATPVTDSIRYYQFSAGPTVVAEATTQAQPQSCFLLDQGNNFNICNTATQPQQITEPLCGKWTKVMEHDIPPNSKGIASVGAGYLEITGKACANGGTACWSSGESRTSPSKSSPNPIRREARHRPTFTTPPFPFQLPR